MIRAQAAAATVPPAVPPCVPPSNRIEWLLKKNVMNAVVQEGGTVFGGAVRDFILHDSHAIEFYKKSENRDPTEIATLYRNRNYLPELDGRFAVPNDVDATIHESRVVQLLERLRFMHFEIELLFQRDPKEYFPDLNIEPNTVRHDRYVIHSFRKGSFKSVLQRVLPHALIGEVESDIELLMNKIANLSRHRIKLDLMVSTVPLHARQPEPPFGNIDFQCNALLYDKRGISLSNELWPTSMFDPVSKAHHMKEIMEDIFHRRASVCFMSAPKEHRIRKMVKKGWSICSPLVKEMREESYDGHCIICQGSVHNQKHFKLVCCDARYHIKCLRDAFEMGPSAMGKTCRCLMCKSMIIRPSHLEAFIQSQMNLDLEAPDH